MITKEKMIGIICVLIGAFRLLPLWKSFTLLNELNTFFTQHPKCNNVINVALV